MAMFDKAPAIKSEQPHPSASAVWTWAALATAVVAATGSLALTLLEQKQACPLCFYQRTFALCLVAVLGQGLLSTALRGGRLAVLALPLALGGLGVAAFHVNLEVRDVLECPVGLFGVATAPKQSLALFAVLTVLLGAGVSAGLRAREVSPLATVLAVVLGGGLAWASISANPKLREPPAKPYGAPPNVCRPPYHATESR